MKNTMGDNSFKNRGRIFLIGFMGSGKTTFGKKLASLTDRPFYDLDEEITHKIGMCISDYFLKYGEDEFRKQEKEALHELARVQEGIIATGGGTPCFYDNMKWMKSKGITIYLNMPAKALLSRLSGKEREKRPLLQGKDDSQLLTYINTTLTERDPYYQQADITLNALTANPKNLLKELV